MQKPDKIIDLEKKLRVEFTEISISEIMTSKFENKAYYALNKNGIVIGLRITRLSCSRITDLADFEDIVKLNLDGNYIIDISALRNFRYLETLSLEDNKISKIHVLGQLTNLRELIFGDYFNQPLVPGSLPVNLTTLTFGQRFNQPLVPGSLPVNLTTRRGQRSAADGNHCTKSPR